MHNPDELRNLALWYREFAEGAGNPDTPTIIPIGVV